MGYSVVDGSELQWEDRDPVVEGLPMRYSANVSKLAGLTQSYGRWWRYPPHTRGRRHADHAQEEVFVVASGRLTMLLGEPPERVEVGPLGVVSVEPGTPLQVRNEGDEEVLLYIYGAPQAREGADFFEDPGEL